MLHLTSSERHFSQLSVLILETDRNELSKRCQVTGYVLAFNGIVDFFMIDMCYKHIFCSKVAQKGKNCSKLPEICSKR